MFMVFVKIVCNYFSFPFLVRAQLWMSHKQLAAAQPLIKDFNWPDRRTVFKFFAVVRFDFLIEDLPSMIHVVPSGFKCFAVQLVEFMFAIQAVDVDPLPLTSL